MTLCYGGIRGMNEYENVCHHNVIIQGGNAAWSVNED